jgi:hypothetical protein
VAQELYRAILSGSVIIRYIYKQLVRNFFFLYPKLLALNINELYSPVVIVFAKC